MINLQRASCEEWNNELRILSGEILNEKQSWNFLWLLYRSNNNLYHRARLFSNLSRARYPRGAVLSLLEISSFPYCSVVQRIAIAHHDQRRVNMALHKSGLLLLQSEAKTAEADFLPQRVQLHRSLQSGQLSPGEFGVGFSGSDVLVRDVVDKDMHIVLITCPWTTPQSRCCPHV